MKVNRTASYFTLITFIIGFMVAIQFKSFQKPSVRETRDAWELRQSIKNEMDLQSRLLQEIRFQDKRIHDYDSEMKNSKEDVLKTTLDELKKETGLTEIQGTGLIITIKQVDVLGTFNQEIPSVSPVVLQRTVNELNMYGAKHISIDGERHINTTVIRDINGVTKVGTQSINRLPFEIRVITKNREVAEKMYNRLQISPIKDDFFVDNLEIEVSVPQNSITIPAHVDPIKVQYMDPVDEKGDG